MPTSTIPCREGVVNVRIADQLSFEWAVYYLRDHRAVYTKGELAYYPASDVDKSSEKSRVADAKYLLTDSKQDATEIWSNEKFYLYPLSPTCGEMGTIVALHAIEKNVGLLTSQHVGQGCER
jgi:hypothetical protein